MRWVAIESRSKSKSDCCAVLQKDAVAQMRGETRIIYTACDRGVFQSPMLARRVGLKRLCRSCVRQLKKRHARVQRPTKEAQREAAMGALGR